MNYIRLHKINKYLTNRNRKDINNSKFDKLYDYINSMDRYQVKQRGDDEFYNDHILYSDNSDRMLIHFNINYQRIIVSQIFKDYINDIHDNNLRGVLMDIIKVHYKNYNNNNLTIEFNDSVTFFGEHNMYSEREQQEVYDKYDFKIVNE